MCSTVEAAVAGCIENDQGMNYCSHCGQPVSLKIPMDDNRERYVCDHCDLIHYQNPNNVCGAILTRGDQVLLCKRAIEPRYGLWTLPAGFMENNETVAEAAARESMEEANAESGHCLSVVCHPWHWGCSIHPVPPG